MNLLPFMLPGLLNGSLVGLMAVLFLRTLSPGTDWLRIRDASAATRRRRAEVASGIGWSG